MEGVQLAMQEARHYTYPDVMVTCDAKDQRAKRIPTASVLLTEVPLPSTAECDRGRKFNQYKQLPSLQHYPLVSQTSWLVEWCHREPGNSWSFTPLVEADDALVTLDLSVNPTVTGICERTDVAPLRIVTEEPLAPYGAQRS